MYHHTRHLLRSLIGLTAMVKHSTNPELREISGIIVDDTENMLTLFDGLRHRQIPKASSLFAVSLPDNKTIEIHGKTLLGHPAERLRRAKKLRW